MSLALIPESTMDRSLEPRAVVQVPVDQEVRIMAVSGGRRRWASWSLMVMVVAFWSVFELNLVHVSAVPAQAPEQCGASGCTLNNAYRLWNDRSTCKAAKVVYPTTEEEIVAEVAEAVRANQKIKVSTTYSHSIPKVACPGTDTGLIISSRKLTSFLSINKTANTVTVQSGITMRALADGLAAHDLALTVASLFDGVTLGGVIANSVHGSSLWDKGGAVHEYVVGVRIVTPASAAEGYARVRDVALGDPDLNAARVHLGVLGVVAAVTLRVEPQFKRSVTIQIVRDDEKLTGANVTDIAKRFQYGEVTWYPSLRQVVYKLDQRVPLATPGDGRNNFFGLQAQLGVTAEAVRAKEEFAERTRSRASKCALAVVIVAAQQAVAYGFEHLQGIPNPGVFPVTGTQDHMMSGGGCQRDPKPLFYCSWDTRVRGLVFFETGAALPLRNLAAFLADVRLLRERAPAGSLCDMDLYTGILMRFVKRTDAYLGLAQDEASDTVMMDLTWTRGGDATTPRLDMDVFQELEQLAFDKHGARPSWGKNRNAPFDGAWAKYPKLKDFLAVKAKFDPAGVFSSEWSDAILGIQGNASSDAPFCAIEGNCKCSRDEHCAPREGYFCRPGLVYPDARVCRYESHS